MDFARADDFSGIMNAENVLGGFARCGVAFTGMSSNNTSTYAMTAETGKRIT